jgi:hypothetical protein
MSLHKAEDTIPDLYAQAVLLQADLIMHALKISLLDDADGNGMLRIMQVILAPRALYVCSRTFWNQA